MTGVVQQLDLLRGPRLVGAGAKPVLKWAGGKGKLVPLILASFPPPAPGGRYFEPFLGGASLFLALQPDGAVLGDINDELVNLYTVLRDELDALVAALRVHRYEKRWFLEVRAQSPRELAPVERAARTVFLNRTCFNGLYRVNKRGEFNVPFGRYANPTICDVDRLRAASRAFQGAELVSGDFASVVAAAAPGDTVYFDPPYVPLTPTASFTGYTAGGFGDEDQARLAEAFDRLTARGVRCIQSNSDTPRVRELYAGHRIEGVEARRAIACRADRRAPVGEVLITGGW